ncbi:MAG: hypothetical protein ACOC14_01395 [Bacillota bacterium]
MQKRDFSIRKTTADDALRIGRVHHQSWHEKTLIAKEHQESERTS